MDGKRDWQAVAWDGRQMIVCTACTAIRWTGQGSRPCPGAPPPEEVNPPEQPA